jgi:hypothetical protein
MPKLHLQGQPLLLEPVPVQYLAEPLKRAWLRVILLKMTYNVVGKNALLTVQHTLIWAQDGRKERASITFFFPRPFGGGVGIVCVFVLF